MREGLTKARLGKVEAGLEPDLRLPDFPAPHYCHYPECYLQSPVGPGSLWAALRGAWRIGAAQPIPRRRKPRPRRKASSRSLGWGLPPSPYHGRSPFFLRGPQQVGPQDDGDVAGCHLVHLLILSQTCQELHQVPGGTGDGLGPGRGRGYQHPSTSPRRSLSQPGVAKVWPRQHTGWLKISDS